ncbi:uncharacterized protein LOC119766915 [Culex quinquefasciatus]|uniref:uncharacterized protein LOC119766915 n=1 Tax=Culex quinquefasciatus TaxID=7176 RepID=UPI0018E2B684|nr:uncharacterized protein LOC119766915 [Culex quinquefasciatus]
MSAKKKEPTPEELFKTIREQQANLASHSGEPISVTQLAEIVSKTLTAVTGLEPLIKTHTRMLSELHVKIDTIGENVDKLIKYFGSVGPGSAHITPQAEHREPKFAPVKSLEGLKSLESKSADPKFVQETVWHFSRLHGKDRFVGKGLDVCHQIVNSFFDPEFLISCSWTGGGRNVKKIPFMVFGKVIDLFLQVVLNSDPQFSMDQLKGFLHQCLRNAKQRAKNLGGKKPMSRKRKLPDGLLETSSEQGPELPMADEEGYDEVDDEADDEEEAFGQQDLSEPSLKIEILDEEIL